MADRIPLAPPPGNQDLLRASAAAVGVEAVARALRWLRGEGPLPRPSSIHLNLTLRCTARCLHCKQWAWPAQGEFTPAELDRLFAVFQSWAVRTVTFGGGNPLLHPHVGEALRLAAAGGMEVGVISEGVDLSESLAADLRAGAAWVRFSLDGPTPAVHDAVRNAPGLFDRVVGAVRALRARPSPVRIAFNCVVQRLNVDRLSDMIDLAGDLGVDALLFKAPHGDDPGGRFRPTAAEWDRFVAWAADRAARPEGGVKTNLGALARLLGPVFGRDDVLAGRPVRGFHRDARVRCFAPLFFLTCDSRGDVYPCDYLQADTRPWGGAYGAMRTAFRLGNVLEDDQAVLGALARLLRDRIHGLPAAGHDECGACTRFCQLNAALTRLDEALGPGPPDDDAVRALLGGAEEAPPFL